VFRKNSAVWKVGTKTGGIIAGIIIVIALFVVLSLLVSGSYLHKQAIEETIKSLGGTVRSIETVELEQTPFISVMESRKGKRIGYANTYYKVVYEKDGTENTAWYRGVNGPFMTHSQTTDFNGNPIEETPENAPLINVYGEKWIFTENP
jgi:hypothetical protein